MQSIFLRAEWRRLVLINYRVDPAVLAPYLPAHTELDFWNDTCYVSLVGFMFQNTRVKGVKMPGHVNFEEVNLRFYVRRHDPELGWKRGVVFIQELVPRPLIAWVANTLYGEKYRAVPMWHEWNTDAGHLQVVYAWKQDGAWQSMGVRAENTPIDLKAGSEAEFITEHYWGYARRDARRTAEYQVEHPRWQLYPVQAWQCEVDFGRVYGPAFHVLDNAEPLSVFLAEGSPVTVRQGRNIGD